MQDGEDNNVIFMDADEASAFLSTSFAPVQLVPVSKAGFRLEVSGARLEPLQIYATDSAFGARFLSVGYFDGFTFSTMSKGVTAVKCGPSLHSISTENSLAVDAETVDRIEMSPDSQFRSVAISSAALESMLARAIGDQPIRRPAFAAASFDGQLAMTCHTIGGIIRQGLGPDGILGANVLALHDLQDALLNLILFGTTHNYSAILARQPVETPKLVRRAIDYMHANAHRPITTMDIAQDLQVGLRSLQKAFQANLATTPHRYLRELRLLYARQELQCAESQSVAEVAAKWGFPWPGEFARLYRAKFGEKPAETRRLSR